MTTLPAVTPEPEPEALPNPPGALRLLALLTAAEGLVMIGYAMADLVIAAVAGSDQWGAVWFVVVGLGLWGLGLLWSARGLLRVRRWAFTPVVFTQLMFGLLALTFFGSASVVAKVAWGAVFTLAVVVLRLAFARDVRNALITPAAEQ
ncbi:MAG TPA: hypothetical protein VMT88_13505 [Actinomycetes bacterium]|nr:hypothetical protein [Actinomycetes bacterium]